MKDWKRNLSITKNIVLLVTALSMIIPFIGIVYADNLRDLALVAFAFTLLIPTFVFNLIDWLNSAKEGDRLEKMEADIDALQKAVQRLERQLKPDELQFAA